MARFLIFPTFLFSIHLILSSSGHVYSATFTLVNQCSYTIWPGLLSSAGTTQLSTTGFALQTGESNSFSVPTAWSGGLWGRTLCTLDSTNKFSCVTGDCGSRRLECAGAGAIPPASLAEFTLNGAGGMDFYDVSLVDGYNLPMEIVPHGGTDGNCSATGCAAELNGACPAELKVAGADGVVACKSACEAFGSSMYCCSGEYASPNTCMPTAYSEYFKRACPDAYSYAHDDLTSTFTCAAADHVITFCPSPAPPADENSPGGAVHPDGSTNTPTSSSTPAGSAFAAAAAAPLLMNSISISILVVSVTCWWSG